MTRPASCPRCGASSMWLNKTTDGRWQHVWCGWVEPKDDEP